MSDEVYNETDAVLMSAVGIISPILAILRHQFPHLVFQSRAEEYHERKEEIEDRKITIKSRVDNVLYVRRNGSSIWHICMLLEYKTPGTLNPKEWIVALKPGEPGFEEEVTLGNRKTFDRTARTHLVHGNAREIAQQSHKDMYHWTHPIVGVTDLRCLIGIKVDSNDINVSGDFSQDLRGSLFLTTKRDRFAKAILALALEGMKLRGFLDHY